MKKLLTIILFLNLMFVLSCSSGKSEVKSEVEKVAIVYSFIFEGTGLPKYDTFLQTTKDLSDSLDKAYYSINNIIPSFKSAANSILSLINAAKKIAEDENELALIFNQLYDSLKVSYIILYIDVDSQGNMRFRVKADVGFSGDVEIINKINNAFEEVNEFIQTIIDAPKNLATAADKSVSLVNQAKELIESAKTDFAGVNALKLPGTIDSLNKAITVLSGVPEKSKKVIDACIKFVDDLKNLIKK